LNSIEDAAKKMKIPRVAHIVGKKERSLTSAFVLDVAGDQLSTKPAMASRLAKVQQSLRNVFGLSIYLIRISVLKSRLHFT
jgi:hypothetical protein